MKIQSILIILADDNGEEEITFSDGKWNCKEPKYPRQLEALIQIWRILKVVFVDNGSIKDLN